MFLLLKECFLLSDSTTVVMTVIISLTWSFLNFGLVSCLTARLLEIDRGIFIKLLESLVCAQETSSKKLGMIWNRL